MKKIRNAKEKKNRLKYPFFQQWKYEEDLYKRNSRLIPYTGDEDFPWLLVLGLSLVKPRLSSYLAK